MLTTLLRPLVCLAVLLIPCASAHAQDAAERRPNVIWITIDDCGPDFRCYGNPLARTPHLDSLAAGGQMFTNCFVSTPVCSPVRSALITGCYATTIASHQHRSQRPLPEGVRPITDILKENGYRCTSLPAQRVKPKELLEGVRPESGKFLTLTGRLKLDFNFNRGADQEMFEIWDPEKKDEPFFALIDFNPQKGPAGFVAGYAEAKGTTVDPADVEVLPYWPDTPAMRQRIARYQEALNVLDTEIGLLLAWLAEQFLRENTLLFVWGDHGMAFLRHKQWCYDSGLSVPLIVSGPGITPGRRTGLVSSIDLAPATLTACGIEPPAFMEGRNFLGPAALPRTHVFASRDRCDETEDRVRAVRDEGFKLIHNYHPERAYVGRNDYTLRSFLEVPLLLEWKEEGRLSPIQARWLGSGKSEWEFYDLRRDPLELENRIDVPEYAERIEDLKRKLADWTTATDAGNPFPEELTTIVPDKALEGVKATRGELR